MQNNNRRSGFNDSRSSRSRRKSFNKGNQRFNSSRNGNSRFKPKGRKGPQEMKPDFDLFIKKAKEVKIEKYVPTHTFETLGLDSLLVNNLKQKNIVTPTPIQDQAIPHLLEKKDIIGIANTGTGKTAAFLLPLIHHTMQNMGERTMILAPTRELAMQIQDELNRIAKNSRIRSVLVVGGMPQYRQVQNLRKKHQFVIGTTGRTLDLTNQGHIKLDGFNALVLDEMDQMLDMGFLPDIKKILAASKDDKHLLFFSATLDKRIETIAKDILDEPVHVSVKTGQTTDNVEQDVVRHKFDDDKLEILHGLLEEHNIDKAIVFENTKHSVKKIEQKLSKRGHRIVAIHGNKTQSQRKRALEAFKAGKSNILVATNVAARGLDIPNVSHVYNYSLPQSREDYVHRIGRTGRAGNKGFAFTFVPVK